MIKPIIIALWSTTILIVGCKSKQDMPGAESKIYFTGVDERDVDGGPLTFSDTSDWRLDDVWTPQESALFPADTLPVCTSVPDLEMYPAAPNPTPDLTKISFRNLSTAVWQMRLVDEDFNVLFPYNFSNFPIGYNTIFLQTIDYPADTLRLYYQVKYNGCVWRGHGDIAVHR